VYAFLADHRQRLFPPELFIDVARQGGGHPSVPAEVIATVMVLQALEGLSDREAISALRRDIAWKVACGRRLDDEGFHPTVLVYWRNRLRSSDRPRRIFDAVGQVVLDATVLEDAVATQDTVTQLVAAIRRVRRLVPKARQVALTSHDDERPGKPECAWDDPQARQALVSGLVNDALAVLDAVADLELGAEQAEAVALVALVAGQDVEPGQRPGSWRIARRVANDRVISTADPQARPTPKTSARRRDGDKGHLATEPETGLVTECALTAANLADGPTGSGCWPASSPAWRCWATAARGLGRPARPCAPPATPDDQADPTPQRGAGRVHHPRLPHRPPGRHPQGPGRRHGADHQLGPGQLRPSLPGLPATPALHHRQGWPDHPPPPARGRAARRPAPGGDPELPAQLPALAADGGTIDRLAGRRWLPAGALPRHRTQRPVVVGPGRRGQPTPAAVLGLAHQDGAWVLA
jgi:hypothetical protein